VQLGFGFLYIIIVAPGASVLVLTSFRII